MILLESGEVVGSVEFGPYNYEYEGSNEMVEKILEGAEDYEEWDTGPSGFDDPITPGEKLVPLDPDGQKEILRQRLSHVNVSIVEGSRANDTRYDKGDTVSTPQGVGVVIDVVTQSKKLPEGKEASDASPTYVVVVEDGRAGVDFYKASDIHATEIRTDVDNPAQDLQEAAARSNSVEAFVKQAIARFRGNQEGHFSWPSSWEKADAPARLIALDAWASMGGDVSACINEMKGNIADPGRFCADFADRLYNYEYWRGSSWAPSE